MTGFSTSGRDDVAASLANIDAKTSDIRQDFEAGRVRVAGGKLTIPTAGTGRFQIRNPTGSGRVVTVLEFTLAATASVDVGYAIDTTLTTPTVYSPFAPNRAVAVTTVAVASGTTAGATGGTNLSPVTRIGADEPYKSEFTTVLLPGQAISAVASAGLSEVGFYASVVWTEDG